MTSRLTTNQRDRQSGSAATADAVVLGIPFDLGAPRRGSGLATRAMRYAGLVDRLEKLGLRVQDAGDVPVPDAPAPHSDRLRNFPAVAAMAEAGFEAARDAIRSGALGVFLGGDHSVAMGTIAGTAAALAERGERLGLIWFDAHGDFNTAQTTPSGHMHGMPFATSLGFGTPELTSLGGFCPKVRPEHAVLIGARDVDPDEQSLIESCGLRMIPMSEVQDRGIQDVIAEAIAIAGAQTDGLYVSCDMDALDPSEAPGTGSPVRNGLSVREMLIAFRQLAATGRVRAIDMVEVDPLLDQQNQSARIAVDLIEAVFSR